MGDQKNQGLLRHPVHCVSPDWAVWPELQGGSCAPIAPERLAQICVGSADCWVLRTCYELRQAGADITLSATPRRDAINIGDIRQIGRKGRGLQTFFLIPRGDGHDPSLANYTVLQNFSLTSARPSVPIPIWPQPGIIPRDPARGARIEVLSFKGADHHLDARFRNDAFLAALAEEGVQLQVGVQSEVAGGQQWADYRETDLVLAVRNLTDYVASIKPASKLTNAWFAQVPALLGPEPAYAEVGTNGEDYIEISHPEDVLAAVRHLRDVPGAYEAMVARGRDKCGAFDNAALVAQWITLLNGSVAEAFERWQRKSALARILEVVGMLWREPASKKNHSKAFGAGRRLLDN